MQRDINFFSVYSSSGRPEGGLDAASKAGIAIVGACLAGVLGFTGYFWFADRQLQKEKSDIQSYLTSPQVVKAASQWDTYTQKLNLLRSYTAKAQSEVDTFKTLPVFDSSLLSGVAAAMPGDVKVTALSYDGKSITLTCTSTDKLSAANFAHTLIQSGKYLSVQYGSVTKDGTGYDFEIVCELKGVSAK